MIKPRTLLPTLTLALTLTLTLFSPPALAEYFDVERFHSDIQIKEDSSFTVTEIIDVEFTQSRHGIFRDIPWEQDIDFEVLSVTNENKQARPYEVIDMGDVLRIKVGDPNVYVSGEQTYEITYNAYNVIRNYEDKDDLMEGFESYDELYWNVNGNDWEVDMEKVSATISLPESLFNGNEALIYECYTGYYGSEYEDCSYQKNGNTVQFESDSKLYSYQGLTLVLGLPPGKLQTPSTLSLETTPKKANVLVNGEYRCQSNCEVFLPMGETILSIKKWGHQSAEEVLNLQETQSINKEIELKPLFWFKLLQTLFLLLLVIIIFNPIYAYLTKGRDPKGRGVIVPHYEAPDKMSPALMGTLYDERVHMRDLTSTIIDLCVRKYMKIKILPAKSKLFGEDDYEFIRINNKEGWDKGLSEFERLFMKKIFKNSGNRKLSSLKNEFYKTLPKLKEILYKNLVKKGYMPKDPNKVRSIYFAKTFLVFFASFMGGGTLIAFELDPFWLLLIPSLALNGLQTLVFSFFMPRKTKKGRLAYEAILGFKMYLETAERDRVKFQEKENLFYKFLPYAMTMKIADKWSKAFKDIYKTPPDWYVGGQRGHFDAYYFTRSVGEMGCQMSQTFSSRPSSSGSGGGSGFSGGSSGGGFGGGGGGSW